MAQARGGSGFETNRAANSSTLSAMQASTGGPGTWTNPSAERLRLTA